MVMLEFRFAFAPSCEAAGNSSVSQCLYSLYQGLKASQWDAAAEQQEGFIGFDRLAAVFEATCLVRLTKEPDETV